MDRRTSNCLNKYSKYAPFHKVHLECTDCDNQYSLYNGPPLHTRIGALCGVAVHPFAHYKVFLFVLEELDVVCQFTQFSLSRYQPFLFSKI